MDRKLTVVNYSKAPFKGTYMPCMKCANGKWKYGANGNCVFDTLEACKRAAAIHIQDSIVDCPAQTTTEPMDIEMQEQYK